MADLFDTETSGKLVADALRENMRAAYAAGFEAGLVRGRSEAWDEIHARILTAYNEAVADKTLAPEAKPPVEQTAPVVAAAASTPPPGPGDIGRATRGAVRKTVLAALAKGPTTIARISEESGFKQNSVRSILYTMRGHGTVVRDGEIWTSTGVGSQESDGSDPDPDATKVDEHPDVDDASGSVEGRSSTDGHGEDMSEGEGQVSRAAD